MTISTTLLFSRAVSLMGQQQSDLASTPRESCNRERASEALRLTRPGSNISRIKASIDELDAYKNSLNAVNDRLTVEESYIGGAKDVLIKLNNLRSKARMGPCLVRISR